MWGIMVSWFAVVMIMNKRFCIIQNPSRKQFQILLVLICFWSPDLAVLQKKKIRNDWHLQQPKIWRKMSSLNIRNSKEKFLFEWCRMKFIFSPRLLWHDFHQYNHLNTTDTMEIVWYSETCWHFAIPITWVF